MSTAAPQLEIRLNGEACQVAAGATVADLVRQLDLPEDRVAIELDGRVIRRPRWGDAKLGTGARVEIVQLVGGG